MASRTIYVGFDGRQVAVSTAVAAVGDGLAQRFQPMIESSATELIGRFDISAADDGYVVSSDCELAAPTSAVNVLEHVSHAIGWRFVKAYPELFWLHASAVARDGVAVMLVGSWGRGKSTLAARLTQQGWKFLSDDLLPYDPRSRTVLPFPRLPSVRTHTAGLELPRERVGELPKVVFAVEPSAVARAPTPVCSIMFPSYARDAADTYELCSPAEAVVELLRNCLNFVDHGGAAVRDCCVLLSRIPAFRVAFSDPRQAIQLVTDLHASTR